MKPIDYARAHVKDVNLRDKIINNCISFPLSVIVNDVETLSECIMLGFSWIKSYEGQAYWQQVVADLKSVDDNVNPSHYKTFNKQPWEMMIDIWGEEAFALHCEMTAFKYRMRMGYKEDNDIEDELGKAMWYEEKAKEYGKKD